MKGFIEVRDSNKTRLINVKHIVEVIDNKIYTDDIPPFASDYPFVDCIENYEEIKQKIAEAVE